MKYQSTYTREQLTEAAAIIRKEIQALTPGFWHRGTDQAGHKVNVHYEDGGYAATINWETSAWCDYLICDQLAEKLQDAGPPFDVAYLSDYEIALEG